MSDILLEREKAGVEIITDHFEPGDAEKFSHYVKKQLILESAFTGQPVLALCGKLWTPTRDPEKFPVCPECKDIYESMTS